MSSRYFATPMQVKLPLIQGTPSTGANSVAVWKDDSNRGKEWLVVVGGDYARDSMRLNNCFTSRDGGRNWRAPVISPQGDRSCVEYLSKKVLVTCGTSGVDLSTDSGMHWKLISTESFHVCRKAKKGTAVFLAGGNGRIGKLIL
jgi:hypothetical protein